MPSSKEDPIQVAAVVAIPDPAASLKAQGEPDTAAEVKAARKAQWKAIPLDKGKPKPLKKHDDDRAARYLNVAHVPRAK